MKIIRISIIFLFTTCQTYSQTINTEAIDKFWKIVDIMKSDQPLTDSLWDDYYNLIGNKNYMRSNRSDSEVLQHRQYLELIFRPSLVDSCKTVQNRINMDDEQGMFQNLYYIKQNENELRTYSKTIASPKYLQLSINLAKKYLPKNKFNPISKDLTIYIMAITSDAAVQPPNMYFGLAILYNFDRFQKGTIAAHEFHHFLRKEKVFTGVISKRDSASYSIIYQINNEGCADLTDKTVLLEHVSQIFGGASTKEWLLGSAAITLGEIDSCFIQNSKPNMAFVSRKAFREITGYSSGHIPGFYMVDLIKRNGYLTELINHNDNPFNIFYLYNKAAKNDKDTPPLFSDITILYLKKIEKQLERTINHK